MGFAKGSTHPTRYSPVIASASEAIHLSATFPRHCERKRSNPSLRENKHGLLRRGVYHRARRRRDPLAPRNDDHYYSPVIAGGTDF